MTGCVPSGLGPREATTCRQPCLRKGKHVKKYLIEFIGTFFFVSTVGHTVINGGAGVIPPLAIGGMLMVMVFAGGHISGGHYNPAVTLAVWLRGKCATKDVPGYWIAQVLAAVAAGFLVLFMKGLPTVNPVPYPGGTVSALIAEFLGTFALAFVVLNVATAKATAGNSFYGLAIGFTVVCCAFAFGGYSGGAFNPGIASGLLTMGLVTASNFWIYLVGDFLGAAAAAAVFKITAED